MGITGKTWAGVGFGVAAGALWGLVFLAPELAHGFTPLQLSAGRYIAYGLFAALLVAPRWRKLASSLGRREWWALARLSLLGNIVYFILLASAVQLGGIAMTSLMIGFLPVAVTIVGSRDKGAVPLARLTPSLLLGATGIICIGWQALAAGSGLFQLSALAGLLAAAGALVCWTVYAVLNSRWLDRLARISAQDWSLLTGLVTGAEALLLIPPALLLGIGDHGAMDWLRFLGVAAGVAILASIVGNALWNRASRLLPLTLMGQMILFETLFALLYGFLWEGRLPTVLEIAAIGCVIASVLACLSAHRAPAEAKIRLEPRYAQD